MIRAPSLPAEPPDLESKPGQNLLPGAVRLSCGHNRELNRESCPLRVKMEALDGEYSTQKSRNRLD